MTPLWVKKTRLKLLNCFFDHQSRRKRFFADNHNRSPANLAMLYLVDDCLGSFFGLRVTLL